MWISSKNLLINVNRCFLLCLSLWLSLFIGEYSYLSVDFYGVDEDCKWFKHRFIIVDERASKQHKLLVVICKIKWFEINISRNYPSIHEKEMWRFAVFSWLITYSEEDRGDFYPQQCLNSEGLVIVDFIDFEYLIAEFNHLFIMVMRLII